MDNSQIADCFSLLAKLMDIHGENSFKAKSYASAAFTIDKLPMQLSAVAREKLFSIKGIGESTGKKVIELLDTGAIKALTEMIEKTPEGILEMMQIKGIGPKKIATIWKEMEIETVGELLYACKENRLKLYKGFGEKTQQNVMETIEFYFKSKGSFLFSQIELMENHVKSFFEKIFLSTKFEFTGAYKRHLEIIPALEILVDENIAAIENKLLEEVDFILLEKDANSILYKTPEGLQLKIYGVDKMPFIQALFYKNCSEEFATAFQTKFPLLAYTNYSTEEAIFLQVGLPFIPPFLREKGAIIDKVIAAPLPAIIETTDIKAIIHSHSDWSDGSNTVEEMANAAIAKGFEYLVLSDHSKSAFYAKGLSEERIKAQHLYIDELNSKLTPFKIFKSIESDILNDGSLDYSNAVLSTFDLVIASVHSNLKMTEEKAMMRLLNAIENPYTTILGHLTGRLLLSRKGYPVDHKRIIDACAANNVVIELNAHPSRLDMDWRYIDYALEKNVLISIDPDAHFIEGFEDIRYGVIAAQKALVTKQQNLSSFGLAAFEKFLLDRKK
jgi:DNA polymerase (family X)